MDNGFLGPVLGWYERHARELPWRERTASPWAVLVSEVMLQQTPVSRVVPAYLKWLERWPTPGALAAEPTGEAVRQWGLLGYPRRALNLHATARILTQRYGGEVPASREDLLALPGIGPYTAAAVASFAFGQRHAVLDTNVRRVLARLLSGAAFPPRTLSAAETRLAESLLPSRPALAARWAVAVMELGALVCTPTSPACARCPLATSCSWRVAGFPDAGKRRAGQRYQGTDRQCRGRLLTVLRRAHGTVEKAELDRAWPDAAQRERALDSLIADGLAEPLTDGTYALPR
jgi:A/G-specific adenine glycosylase